jgi:DNA-binding transcriptional ArsR family regulator
MGCTGKQAVAPKTSPADAARCERLLDARPCFDKTGNVEERIAVDALAALAQGMRLRVFRALVGAEPRGMTPGELAALLDLAPSTLSFHLKELARAGLAVHERDGRHLIYRPSLVRMNELVAYLTAHCCQGAGCEPLPAAVACRPRAASRRSAA